ncbi:MAG: ActS/PrrB/RegB family redox-sensitive histidine kinase [Hyphomicrobiaceae bacterium]|nr:ActS/PrrB/RegB family redox-sensitive histidine kinase [Hyphomicrobiaceae bacterium]
MPTSGRVRSTENESRLRLQTIVRLRWFAVAGQLFAIALVYFGLGYELPAGICLAVIALSAWLNVYLRIRYPVRHRLSAAFAMSLLAYDTLQLALLLYLTGGIENPFTLLIVAPVIVSAASLPARNTVFLGVLALTATALLINYGRPLPWRAGEALTLPLLYKYGIFAAVACGMTFLALYAFRLSKESRQMSAALAATETVLAREQKLHALDGLAAAAAHELGTPLSTIVVVTKELEREVPPDSPLAEDIKLLRSQAQRCREILQKLTRQPSEQDPHHTSLPVTQLIEEAAEPYHAFGARLRLSAHPADGTIGPAAAEPVCERLPGVIYGLGNFIENAVDFAAAKVEVTAVWTESNVTVTVSDDGPGFPPDVMDALGEPYVTTRPPRAGRSRGATDTSGLGLGFFIAKTLLERSGAQVELSNREPPAHGAIVTVTWPRSQFHLPPQPRPLAAEAAAPAGTIAPSPSS